MGDMALAKLIDEVEAINRWTDRKVAEQAVQRGHTLTTSDLTNFRRLGMKVLSPAKVKGLAAGLQIPAHVVAAAVLTDLGIDLPHDAVTVERAIELDVMLPAHTKRTLLAIVAQAREDVSGGHR